MQLNREASTSLLPLKPTSFHVPCGLRNIGNTCFMNSILQNLLASPYLNEYMLSQFPQARKLRKTLLAQSFADLLSKVRNSGGAAVTPSDLKSQVSQTVSQFSGYGQEDA